MHCDDDTLCNATEPDYYDTSLYPFKNDDKPLYNNEEPRTITLTMRKTVVSEKDGCNL